MIKNLIKHLTKNTDTGLQLRALPSILEFPDMYALGKKSVYMRCTDCGKSPSSLKDITNVEEKSICVACERERMADDLRAEAYNEKVWEVEQEMREFGLDPLNTDDIISYFDERDF